MLQTLETYRSFLSTWECKSLRLIYVALALNIHESPTRVMFDCLQKQLTSSTEINDTLESIEKI